MDLRRAFVVSFATVMLCAPARASQPSGSALKLLSNPVVYAEVAGGPEGLPPVSCGGFYLQEPIPATTLGATDSLTFDLALVPFQEGSTRLILSGAGACWSQLLDFHDGLVNGLAYNRQGWNDVRVMLRVATQDYELTINGAHAGPFPISDGNLGGCQTISEVNVSGTFLGEGIAWLDTLSLIHTTEAGSMVLFQNPFSFCSGGTWSTYVGGALVVEPPKKLRPR